MMWLATLVSLAALCLFGMFALAVLSALPRDTGHAMVSGFAAGTALLAAIGSIMVMVGIRLSLIPFYILLGVLAIIAFRTGRFVVPRVILARDSAAKVMLGVTALVLVLIVVASLQDRLWWDGWAIWALKGRVLFLDNTLSPAFLSADGGYSFTHLDYPLGLPLTHWWTWSHSGVAAPAIASLTGAVWFAVLPLLLWCGLRSRADHRIAALAVLGLSLFWPIAFYATGGTADIVIAVALLGAVIELDRLLTADDRGALVRFAVFLTLGVFAKNEGLAIAAVCVAVAAMALWCRGERRLDRLLILAVPFGAILPWWLFVSRLEVREPLLAPTATSAIFERSAALLSSIGRLGRSISWLPVPFIAAVGIVALLRRGTAGIAAGWTIIAAYFCVVASVYLLTPQDIHWLLTTSLPRVLSVFVAPLVFLSAAAVTRHTSEPVPA